MKTKHSQCQFHLNLQTITRKISSQSQQKWYVHFCLHHTVTWTFLSELSDGFSHVGTVKFTQINMCTHAESVHEDARRHTQLRPASIETTVTHIPFIQGAMQQTHTPTRTASSPRQSSHKCFSSILASSLNSCKSQQLPAFPDIWLTHPRTIKHIVRECAPQSTSWSVEKPLCAAVSFALPFPSSFTLCPSVPVHGVSSVRSDMFSTHSSHWLPARPQAAVSSPSYYQVSFGVSVDFVTWLSTPGWLLWEKMPISQHLP